MKKTGFTIPFNGPDLKIEPFRGSGAGGQNRNKNSTGIRIRHFPSGIVIEAQEYKSQAQNKKAALKRLVENKLFRSWCMLQIQAREKGFKDLNAQVEALMSDDNLKVEVVKEGKWIEKCGEAKPK